MLLFARGIVFEPLWEYVNSLKMNTCWVDDYTMENCLSFLWDLEHTEEVAFLQKGPDHAFFNWLIAKHIRIFIVNTEQMSRYGHETEDEVFFPFRLWLVHYLNTYSCHLIDYSQQNICIWRKMYPDIKTKKMHLKCFLPPVLSLIPKKTKDIVFVGDCNSKHRRTILETISNITILQGCYGAKRDKQLFGHKILLNVHYDIHYTILEEMRVLPCVFAQMIVVSETSDMDKAHPLYPFILFADYDKLAEKIEYVLANYELVHYNLYSRNNKTRFDCLREDILAYENRHNNTNQ